jgi:hypothetical protein
MASFHSTSINCGIAHLSFLFFHPKNQDLPRQRKKKTSWILDFRLACFKGIDWIWESASYSREREKSFRSCGCGLLVYATESCVLHPNQARCFISLSWPFLCSLYYLFGDMYSRKRYFVMSLQFLTIMISLLDRDKYI